MNALRNNWVMSYLLIAAFGGLIAYQGCGGDDNRRVTMADSRTDEGQTDIGLSILKAPEKVNFQLPENWSDVSYEVKDDSIILDNGKLKFQVINTRASTRVHQDQAAIEIPWIDKCGATTKWFYYAFDTPGHPFNDGNGNSINVPHWNFCLYHTRKDMLLDIEQSTPKRAFIDAHVWISASENKIKVSFSKPTGINRSRPCTSRDTAISFDEAADMAIDAMKDYWQQIKSTLGLVGEIFVAVVLIAVVVVAIIYLWPEIARALGILLRLIAAGLTGAALNLAFIAAVIGEGSDDDNDGGGGGGDDDSSGDTGGTDDDDSSGGGGGGGTIPPPPDTTPPFIKSSSIEILGNGVFNLKVDIGDSGSGALKNQMWLQDPSYKWITVGGWNFDIPSANPKDMNGLKVGTWKFFVSAYDKAGNFLDKTDTGKTINWGPPKVEWSEIQGPGVTGCSTYRIHATGRYGHEGIDWIELFTWKKDNRYYRIGQRKFSWKAEWFINPLDYDLVEGTYRMSVVIMDKSGYKADLIDAGAKLKVPDLVIPSENLESPLIEPAPFVKSYNNIEIVAGDVPSKPMTNKIPITITLGGKGISNMGEWCVLVFGKNGQSGSYVAPSTRQSGKTIKCTVDTNDLPTGKLTVGAAVYLKGDNKNGHIIHSCTRVLVDKTPPKPDDKLPVVTGPEPYSTVSTASPTAEMCMRFAMMDKGGSGTSWFKLRLHHLNSGVISDSKDPDPKGYWGITHFGLTRFSPGKVVLEYQAKDHLQNYSGDTWKDTGIWYMLDDQ